MSIVDNLQSDKKEAMMPCQLLHRINPEQNMARFYRVEVTPDLVIDLDDLAAKAAATGARHLLVSHMRGHICDLDRLAVLCDRLKPGGDGKVLFEVHCGYCHLTGGMGTNLLTKQQVMAGNSPDKGLLANRIDLTSDYVKTVVRMGKGAMPQQTKVDLTDAELDAVARYLGKGK